MPRFHFNIHDSKSFMDEIGLDLPSEDVARREAVWVAGQAIGDDKHRLALGDDWAMEVTDDRGLVLFRLDFHVTSSPVLRIAR